MHGVIIGNPGFLIGGMGTKSHAMDFIKQFQNKLFTAQRYCKIEDQKPWPGLACNQDIPAKEDLK